MVEAGNVCADCLQGQHLAKYFYGKGSKIIACDDVSIKVFHEKTVGLVGESGCGKTTAGRLLLRLINADSGEVLYKNINLSAITEKELRPLRKNFQMIFQDSKSAFNPRMRVFDALRESIRLYEWVRIRELRERIADIISRVNLSKGILQNFIGNLSGGELKRLDIARALTIHPEYLIADEPLTLLDISIQGQIAQLLMEVQQTEGIGILFISHDLRMVEMLSDTVAVMYRGKIIERASRKDITGKPLHPYTRHLWNPKSSLFFIGFREGGCVYKNRCFLFQKKGFPALCSEQQPELLEYRKDHFAACHFAGE